MEVRVENLRLTVEGCRRPLLLEELPCLQDLDPLRRFLAATEVALANIEGERKSARAYEQPEV